MSTYSCEVKGLDQSLTVGQVFELHCQGDVPATFQVSKAQITGLQDKYTLKLLKMESPDSTHANLQLTSYRVGMQNFDQIQVTDGTTTLDFPAVHFEVKSVLPPPQQGATQQQPPKPYGPMGPLILPVPWVYWALVASVFGIFILLSAWSWRKRKNRLEILREIKKRTTGPNPVAQFHRDLRILTRKAGLQDTQGDLLISPDVYMKELRMIGETFWGQKYRLALLGQPSERLEKEFKSYAPKTYIKFKSQLRFWNNRWQKLNASTKSAHLQDYRDITLETRNLIEKMAEEEL